MLLAISFLFHPSIPSFAPPSKLGLILINPTSSKRGGCSSPHQPRDTRLICGVNIHSPLPSPSHPLACRRPHRSLSGASEARGASGLPPGAVGAFAPRSRRIDGPAGRFRGPVSSGAGAYSFWEGKLKRKRQKKGKNNKKHGALVSPFAFCAAHIRFCSLRVG